MSGVKTYGIDLDGVCFNFSDAFRIWLNGALDIDLQRHEITSYYWYKNSKDVSENQFFEEFDKFGIEGHGYRHLELLPGALEGLNKIHAAGHKIVYITSRPEYARQDTIDSLEEHGFPQRDNLYFSKKTKSDLVKEHEVDVFIDDSPTTVADLTANTRADVYCRSYKYNEHLDDAFFTRVDSWDDFIAEEELNGRLQMS